MEFENKRLLQLMLLLLARSIVVRGGAGGDFDEYVESHCSRKCGSVDIVYPFGMGKPACYHDEHFKITCNHSSNPPKPLLAGGSNMEVLEIQLDSGQVRIKESLARDCYASNGTRITSGEASLNIYRPGAFTINDTRNRFAAIGCDTYAIVKGYQGQRRYTSGCMSICDETDDLVNGSCKGAGCCMIAIPDGLDHITVEVDSYYNHKNVWQFSPCSYAAIVEKDRFNFSSTYLKDFQKIDSLPMVLDWAIGMNQTCEIAQQNRSSYACGEHAYCYVPEKSSGYRCKCWPGYEGNPYLLKGCTDVDECKNSTLNDCVSGCRNNAGNYTCFCPKGYHGDGQKNGKRCIANRFHVVGFSVGTGMGAVILILVSSWLYFALKKRKLMKLKQKFFERNGGLILKEQLYGCGNESPCITRIFTAREIKEATNNYNESRKIGRGGFGTVYKGFLADGTVVAVKKSITVDQSQVEQFINEILVLSKIKHKSVLKLLGCCLETKVPLLVYEFISNGTLFDHIHNQSKERTISWETRLKIAVETAIVLSYMHCEASSTAIIHRDIKSENILLDDDYNAKLCDFGTSRLVPMDHNQLSTMVMGTLGYLDPEYFHSGHLTEKSDVYSFGVILLELLTGKKPISLEKPEMERNLVTVFLHSLKEDRLLEILEDRVVTEGNLELLKEIAELAKRCLRVRGEERPTMREVATELEELKMMVHHHPR